MYRRLPNGAFVKAYKPVEIVPLQRDHSIGVITPVWGRLAVTRLFWAGIQRLRRQWEPYRVRVYIAGSEPEHRELAEEHGGIWIEAPNYVGMKFNQAMQRAWEDRVAFAMLLGSDDIVSPRLAQQYLDLMQDGVPYFGVRRVTVIQPSTQQACSVGNNAMHRRGEVVGAGRVLAWPLIQRAQGHFWKDDAMSGNDGQMTRRLEAIQAPAPCCYPGAEEACVIDVKSTENIWSYEHVSSFTCSSRPIGYRQVVDLLSAPERAVLAELESSV